MVLTEISIVSQGSPIALGTPDKLVAFDLEFDFATTYRSPYTLIQLHQHQPGDVNKPLISFEIDDKASPGTIRGLDDGGRQMKFTPR